MKNKIITLIIFLFCFMPSSRAEDVVLYSEAQVIGCRSIGNTNIFLNDPNDYSSIKNGFIHVANGCASLPAVAFKYMKIVNGSVVEMSQDEKDAVNASEASAQIASTRSGAKDSTSGFSPSAVYLRAFIDILIDEINILRADIDAISKESSQITDRNRPNRTRTQLKTAIENRIDSGNADT